MTDINELKRKKEIEILNEMVKIYCKKKHKSPTLCGKCTELLEYCIERVNKCPHIEYKTFCKFCNTHCYSPKMQSEIREVMKFSAKRMLFYRPFTVLRHLFLSISLRGKR